MLASPSRLAALVSDLRRRHVFRMTSSRASSFAFKGPALDVREVAARLGVRMVLEGGVRRAGDRLRVNAQLTDADAGYQLWSVRFDRVLDDVFAIQDGIAAAIVPALLASTRAPQSASGCASSMSSRWRTIPRWSNTCALQAWAPRGLLAAPDPDRVRSLTLSGSTSHWVGPCRAASCPS